MSSPTFEEVAQLVAEQSNTKLDRLAPETELEKDLGISGDDFAELMEEFSERFGTDMSGYLWYFHTGPEGWSLVDLFFDRYRSIEQIPVTVQMLVDSARAGRWLVEYPPHDPSQRRWAFRIHPLLIVGFLLFLLTRCAT